MRGCYRFITISVRSFLTRAEHGPGGVGVVAAAPRIGAIRRPARIFPRCNTGVPVRPPRQDGRGSPPRRAIGSLRWQKGCSIRQRHTTGGLFGSGCIDCGGDAGRPAARPAAGMAVTQRGRHDPSRHDLCFLEACGGLRSRIEDRGRCHRGTLANDPLDAAVGRPGSICRPPPTAARQCRGCIALPAGVNMPLTMSGSQIIV